MMVYPNPGMGNKNEIKIPSPNPGASKKKVVKNSVLKKKPVKSGDMAFPMPIVGKTRRNSGGIVGPTGSNVNSVYNTY